ncbi:MAG: hypothetical protein EHM46_03900 [Bacteroidetes bacterium]|nr:MAG: hypothetical protein EHM46_03900 [Bacteroidota bacterium]
MKKFMLHYMAPVDAIEGMSQVPPEQREEGMKAWYTWRDSVGDKLLDLGSPLGPGTNFDGSGKTGGNGPDIIVAGYSFIQANDMEEVKDLVKGHPHLGWHERCSINIYECIEM